MILYKQGSFLYQRQFCNDSKPNSLKSFSLGVPQMAPVKADVALY